MTAPWVRTAEFDAFGPWVLQVTTAHEVPPLFQPHADLTGTRLVVKVPRPIERRDARPDMDLYDHLVLTREDGVEILTRGHQGGVLRTALAASDLLALENSVALLAGRLTLHTRTSAPVEIAYNGSSAALVDTLVADVRRMWRPGSAAEPAVNAPPRRGSLGPADQDLVARVRDLTAADPALRPLWLRRRTTAPPRDTVLAGLIDQVFPADLHASVVCATESELVVVHRRDGLARRSMPAHSIATTVAPLGRGLHAERSEDPHRPGVVRLRLAPTSVSFLVTDDDGVEAAVRAVIAGR